MSKALVLLSGGIDSTTCLAIAREQCDVVCGLSFIYGQRHAKEVMAAKEICRVFEVPHVVLGIPNVFGGSDSSVLVAGAAVPHLSYEEMKQYRIPPTYVPQRNLIFLSLASALAIVQDFRYVYLGIHQEDSEAAYPDCTPEFFRAARTAVSLGSGEKVLLKAPLLMFSKVSVIRRATSLSVPLHLTWSCYEGGELHCGQCPTCISRIEAFKWAGIEDPTVYKEGCSL